MLTTWTVEDGRCRVREGAVSDVTAALPAPELRAAAVVAVDDDVAVIRGIAIHLDDVAGREIIVGEYRRKLRVLPTGRTYRIGSRPGETGGSDQGEGQGGLGETTHG